MSPTDTTPLAWEADGPAWSSHGMKPGRPDTWVAHENYSTFEISAEARRPAGVQPEHAKTVYVLIAYLDGDANDHESLHATLEAAQAKAETLR